MITKLLFKWDILYLFGDTIIILIFKPFILTVTFIIWLYFIGYMNKIFLILKLKNLILYDDSHIWFD